MKCRHSILEILWRVESYSYSYFGSISPGWKFRMFLNRPASQSRSRRFLRFNDYSHRILGGYFAHFPEIDHESRKLTNAFSRLKITLSHVFGNLLSMQELQSVAWWNATEIPSNEKVRENLTHSCRAMHCEQLRRFVRHSLIFGINLKLELPLLSRVFIETESSMH